MFGAINFKRFGKPLAVVVLLSILLISFSSFKPDSSIARYRSISASPMSGKTTSPRYKHPIMILQHDCRCQREASLRQLAETSIAQHTKYAASHGYVYEVSSNNFLPEEGWEGAGFLNKIHLILKLVLAELDHEEPVEWIL
jgi:hypothetical protein